VLLHRVSRLRRLGNSGRESPQLWRLAVQVQEARDEDTNLVQASRLFRRGLTT
jgi:hypothetical protein